jgi:N-acetylmuramoyl-L-alanine amidase/beta-lactamase regulating signal transducer with metallopeptidase domain
MNNLINHLLISHLLPTPLGLLVKTTLLLLTAGAACYALRRASAATRHLVWSVALGGVLLVPILSLSLPQWKVAWSHVSASATIEPMAAPQAPLLPLAPTDASAVSQVTPPSALVSDESESLPAVALVSQAVPVPTSGHQLSAFTYALGIGLFVWLIGLLAVLGQLFVGLSRLARIDRHSIPLEHRELQVAENVRGRMGLRRPVRFLRAAEATAVAVPVTWGILRPVVLLPAQSNAWSEDCLRAALLHELAHVSRWDWPTQLIARLACALYWWHPLVWWAARQAREESECACDDLVLGTGMKAADYAQRLVEVVRSLPVGAPTRTVAVAMAQPSEVEGRVKAVLATGKDRSHLSQRRLTLTLMMLGFLLLPLSTLRPVLRAAAADGQMNNDQINAVPVTPGYQQTLPNGYTVGVAGVTPVTPSGNGRGMFSDPYWGPDGALLPSPLAKTGSDQNRFGWESTPTHPLFALDLRFIHPGPAAPVSNISTYCQITSAEGHVVFLGRQPFQRFNTRRWTKSEILPVTASSRAHNCSLRLGIAAGKWQTAATLPVRLTPQTGSLSIELGDKPSVVYQTQYPGRIERIDSFLGTSGQIGNVARRAVIVDDSGREILLQEGVGSRGTLIDNLTCRHGFLSRDYPKTTLPHVKAILLQTRPYQMAEFRNIKLQPSDTALLMQATDPAVTPFQGHPIVVVDAGHGGRDTGGIGLNRVMEKDLNLSIAEQLRTELERHGAVVYMTRSDDTLPSIQDRPHLAAVRHADYFISVHCDLRSATPPNTHSDGQGTQVFFHGNDAKCHRLAEDISQQIGEFSDLSPNRVSSDTTRFVTGFGVLRGASMPAVLVECGYLDNAHDLERLRDPQGQQRIADGIAQGLIRFQAQN